MDQYKSLPGIERPEREGDGLQIKRGQVKALIRLSTYTYVDQARIIPIFDVVKN